MDLAYLHYRFAEGASEWRWSSFSPREMACPKTGKLRVDCPFMDRLQALRDAYRKPITIVSGYRTPEYNAEVTRGRSASGAHTFGRAVDIYVNDRERDVPLILQLAWTHGFTRCGLQLSAEDWRLHLDDMTARDGFAVREDGRGLYCWTYNDENRNMRRNSN